MYGYRELNSQAMRLKYPTRYIYTGRAGYYVSLTES